MKNFPSSLFCSSWLQPHLCYHCYLMPDQVTAMGEDPPSFPYIRSWYSNGHMDPTNVLDWGRDSGLA